MQRKGAEAGSRIRWPNGYSEAVPDYYDAVGNATYPGLATRDVVYLGCFRAHSSNVINFCAEAPTVHLPSNSTNGRYGGGHNPEQDLQSDRSEQEGDGSGAEQENTIVYVFPRSLTPEVCKHVAEVSVGAKEFSDMRVGIAGEILAPEKRGV